MENVTDNELLARIRNSDEQAFYLFCRRHWKPLYIRVLTEAGEKKEAFERVKDIFVRLWDNRRRLSNFVGVDGKQILERIW